MAERQTVPVLPIRGTVVFPGYATTLAVARPMSLKALEAASEGERLIFVVAEREPSDTPAPDALYMVGVLARLGPVQMGHGTLQVVLTGEQRAAAIDYLPGEFMRAVVVPLQQLPPRAPEDPVFLALYREARERALELGRLRGVSEEILSRVLASVSDAGSFSDLVANFLEIGVAEKQELLETPDTEDRLRRVLIHIQRELELQKAQQQIKDDVQKELGDRQREMYLREQMKAIQRELGESSDNRELDQLKQKLEKLELLPDARAEVERELARLARTSPESMEAQVIRTYLEWVAELPWNTRSEDNMDLKRAAEVLEEDHYGLRDVKDRVLEFLSVRLLNARQADQPSRALAHGPILLFVGPPGVGKTSIAQSIAKALGRKYVRAALGGIRDEADIRGHRRTYVGALPGRLIQGLRQAGSKNPVFLLDEVDKLGVSLQGDPASALLEVLDPAQNATFTDHYLGIQFDLSEVLFIATGNFLHRIPPPLLDRMELVEFAGYTEREKVEIAKRYLVPRQLAESGLAGRSEAITFDDGAIMAIVVAYTRESGVRQLERQLGAVTRKLARRIASDEPVQHAVDERFVRELLGRPRVRPEHASPKDEIGVATGLYYTPAGGDIMFVEAAIRRRRERPSNGGDVAISGDIALILTGQLGDVMRESARAALTFVATHAAELGIPPERLDSIEAHVHVPAGAVPKDGPSAGVAIVTALASALSGRAVRHEVAMTGEVTLRGHVLPIGGVKEKVLGAHRAGISDVILPLANESDLEDVPEEVRGMLRFHPVPTLAQVLAIALVPDESAKHAEDGNAQSDDVSSGTARFEA
jgi:ATP-dependent Lon protease